MKKIIQTFAFMSFVLGVTACGGSSKSSSGISEYEKIANKIIARTEELADELKLDLNVEYVKHSELNEDYIILSYSDKNGVVYTAMDISKFNSYEDSSSGLDQFFKEARVYDHLDYMIDTGEYVHAGTGLRFSKTTMTSADTAKVQELVDRYRMNGLSLQFSVEFGLKPTRAKELAGLTLQIKYSDRPKMTRYQYDLYSKAFFGSTPSEIADAIDAELMGDKRLMKNIYQKAAKVNEISESSVMKLAELFIIE